MQASSRGAVNFTFTATCGRKLCTGYTLYTARADEHKNQVIKHYSIAPKDLDIQTRFVLKKTRNKFD